MEILQLRYFLESAKTENFSKTAEKYMVPTSSVSSSIRRLEAELHCPLFDRTANRLRLNRNGKRFSHALQTAFDEIETAMQELSAEQEDTREIRLWIRALRSDITDAIIEFRKLHPQIVFKTVFDFSDQDPDSFDLIIDERTDRYPTLTCNELCRMGLSFTASKDSPLCGRKWTVRQLSQQAFVSMGENSNMHNLLLHTCQKAGFTPNISVLCNDAKCFEKLVESGIGIGLERSAAKGAHAERICPLQVTDFHEQYIVCAYSQQPLYGNVQHFLNFLQHRTY